jgi:hypothetical protein
MEYQVFFAARHSHYNKTKVNNEMRNIKRMLRNIESFKTFCDNYEVLDLNKHTVIKNYRRLHDMYCYGPDMGTFIFVMGKN